MNLEVGDTNMKNGLGQPKNLLVFIKQWDILLAFMDKEQKEKKSKKCG